MIPRLASPRSSFAALLGLGGTISVLCYPLIKKFLGRNSRLLSEGTISQLEFLIGYHGRRTLRLASTILLRVGLAL